MGWYHLHKTWPLRKVFCKLERHDFDLPQIKEGDIVLTCFYCGKKRRCVGAARYDKPMALIAWWNEAAELVTALNAKDLERALRRARGLRDSLREAVESPSVE